MRKVALLHILEGSSVSAGAEGSGVLVAAALSVSRDITLEKLVKKISLVQICKRKGRSVLTGFSDNFGSLFDFAPKHKGSSFL